MVNIWAEWQVNVCLVFNRMPGQIQANTNINTLFVYLLLMVGHQ